MIGLNKFYMGAVLLLLAFGLGFALPVGATSVTAGTPVTLSSVSAGTASAWGGNITQVNLTINSSTLHWQAFYGTVNGSLRLAANATAAVKIWSVSTITGQIYASQSSNIDFTLVNSTGVNLSNTDSAFSFLSGAADSATNSGTNNANPAFNVSQYPVSANSRPVITTMNGSGAQAWQEVVLTTDNTTASKYVFTGLLNNSGNSFSNVSAQFQIIVPANQVGTTAATTYYFYGEII